MYEIEFTVRAAQDLSWFKKSGQNEILDGIEAQLCYEPTVETRNRKRLRPGQAAEWELRVGRFRVFYDVDQEEFSVSIQAVGLKVGNKVYFQGKEQKQ